MTESFDIATDQDVYTALQELREEPYGAGRSARTEELVEAAERIASDEAAASAMLELLTAYEYGDELRKAPVLFSRILKLHTAKPEVFSDWEAHRVFWCFKWITSSLISLPEIPLATIEGWIEQMNQHYYAAGKPLAAVHTSRYRLAAHTGVDLDLAYELWATRPRDEFSDCEACEARARGIYWRDKGEDARALREWQPVLDGSKSCAEEPAATISHALLPLVREGRLDEAASFHRVGYRATKGNVSMDGAVGRHLEFLALTGNAARGLELLAENRGRLDSTTDALNRLDYLGAIAVLLARLSAEGSGAVPMTGAGGSAHTVDSLSAELRAQTAELARGFDERNGTAYVSDWLQARVSGQPVTTEPLPLGIRTVSSAATAPAAPSPVQSAPIPTDFAALLEEARQAVTLNKPGASRLWEAVHDRIDEAELDDTLRAELLAEEATAHAKRGRFVESARSARKARELFTAAGDPGRALAAWGRAAWATALGALDEGAAEANTDADLMAELDEVLATAQALFAAGGVEAKSVSVVWHCRAAVALRRALGSNDEHAGPEALDEAAIPAAMTEIAAFRDFALEHGLKERASVADALDAQMLTAGGQHEQAAARLAHAIERVDDGEQPWQLPYLLAKRGQLLNRLRRLDEAAEALRRALALSAQWPNDDDPRAPEAAAGLLLELGQNRLWAGDFGAAVTHLTAGAAKMDRIGRSLQATHARALLGRALLAAGRETDGIAVLESLMDEEPEKRLPPPMHAQLRLELGRALINQGEPREAAEVLAGLAEFVESWEDRAVLTLVVCDLACALSMAKLWEPAAAAIDRGLAAHVDGPNPAAVGKMLRVAAETGYRNRGEEGAEHALELLRRADEINEASAQVQWSETALNAGARTQAFAAVHRNEQALEAAEKSIAAWTAVGDQALPQYAEAVRIASAIEGLRLGRIDQAVARLNPVIARCREVGFEDGVRALTRQAEHLRKQAGA